MKRPKARVIGYADAQRGQADEKWPMVHLLFNPGNGYDIKDMCVPPEEARAIATQLIKAAKAVDNGKDHDWQHTWEECEPWDEV
jgi:hypothetical protein